MFERLSSELTLMVGDCLETDKDVVSFASANHSLYLLFKSRVEVRKSLKSLYLIRTLGIHAVNDSSAFNDKYFRFAAGPLNQDFSTQSECYESEEVAKKKCGLKGTSYGIFHIKKPEDENSTYEGGAFELTTECIKGVALMDELRSFVFFENPGYNLKKIVEDCLQKRSSEVDNEHRATINAYAE